MQDAANYRVSVKALIRDDDGRILLTRQSNGKWEILGGGLEHGEEPHAGLAREVMEEAGLRLTHIAATPSYFTTMYSEKHRVYFANVIYDAALEHLDFVPSDECVELRFVTTSDAMGLNLHTNVRKLLSLL